MKKTLTVVLKVAILVFILFWVIMLLTDYFRARKNLEPLFCISEKENVYEDGTTSICTGLGYKYIRYNRDCLSASEFGPFLIKERTCSTD